jgi:hypothetical protein
MHRSLIFFSAKAIRNNTTGSSIGGGQLKALNQSFIVNWCMTPWGRLDTVTNGRFQVSELNDSFPAMNLKSGRSPGDPNRS